MLDGRVNVCSAEFYAQVQVRAWLDVHKHRVQGSHNQLLTERAKSTHELEEGARDGRPAWPGSPFPLLYPALRAGPLFRPPGPFI